MMAYQGMQSFKAENQRKTVLLLILFPAFLIFVIWIIFSLFFCSSWAEGWSKTLGILPWVLIGIGIRGIVSFISQKDIMFGLSGAKAITRKENPEIYNIVENLCISRGLPMPKIAIMNEAGMNAFATGWKKDDSWIAFTSGLLQNLNKREIEAVAGHELTHLRNRDSLLMYVAYVFVGVISLAGEALARAGSLGGNLSSENGSSNKGLGIAVFGYAFLALGYLFYPLVKLAISRKREYMADLGSVELTRDNQAMISALRKISNNSYVANANTGISSFFIAEPKSFPFNNMRARRGMRNYASNGTKTKTSIRDSHPSIDDRIERLQSY